MTALSPIGVEALIPNPTLKPLAFLVGEWRTTGTHPMVPDTTLTGRASFAWHQGGAFLIMHTDMEDDRFPSGVAIFAGDGDGRFMMSYFDQRGVARLYEVEVGEGSLTWRRDDPELAQSNTLTVANDGRTLVGEGRMSQKGGPWTDDLSLTYERVGD